MMDLEKGTTANPATNHQSKYRRNIANSALSVNFKGNYFDFNSTTSYQYLKDFMRMDIDYMPADFMHLEQKQQQNAFTQDRKSTRLNSSHANISYAVFCLKKKNITAIRCKTPTVIHITL